MVAFSQRFGSVCVCTEDEEKAQSHTSLLRYQATQPVIHGELNRKGSDADRPP